MKHPFETCQPRRSGVVRSHTHLRATRRGGVSASSLAGRARKEGRRTTSRTGAVTPGRARPCRRRGRPARTSRPAARASRSTRRSPARARRTRAARCSRRARCAACPSRSAGGRASCERGKGRGFSCGAGAVGRAERKETHLSTTLSWTGARSAMGCCCCCWAAGSGRPRGRVSRRRIEAVQIKATARMSGRRSRSLDARGPWCEGPPMRGSVVQDRPGSVQRASGGGGGGRAVGASHFVARSVPTLARRSQLHRDALEPAWPAQELDLEL